MSGIYPIVGVKFHPPARAILAVLPVGTELELIPEPDNPYDENAIMIWINGKEIPEHCRAELEFLAAGYGFHASEIIPNYWHLGYIPRALAAQMQPFTMCKGKFQVGAEGASKVEI